MLLSKSASVKWNSYTKKFYEQKGYSFTSYGEESDVLISDLMPTTTSKVVVRCDYCNSDFEKEYRKYIKQNEKQNMNKDACQNCKIVKQQDLYLHKHGVSNPMKNKEIANKTSKTLRTNFQNVRDGFYDMNYTLLSVENEFENYKSKLSYVCNRHPEVGVQISTYASLRRGGCCTRCRYEKMADKRRLEFDFVKREFEKLGCILIEEEYKHSQIPLKYICKEHKDVVQKMNYASLQQGQGCSLCSYEKRRLNPSNWNGGVTNLRKHLREKLSQWKNESMKLCNYRCVITGDKFDVIHHLLSFHKILDIVLQETGLPVHVQIGDYTLDELIQLENKCSEVHYRFPLGVCLRDDIHKLYHSIYGFDNTPEQFEEFKGMYYSNQSEMPIVS